MWKSLDGRLASGSTPSTVTSGAIADGATLMFRVVLFVMATFVCRYMMPSGTDSALVVIEKLNMDDVVYVRAYVDEPDLGKVSPGARVTVTSDSTDRVYEGQVGFVSPRAEFTPKSVETPELRTDLVYRLRIIIREPDDALRQGMPVTVRLADA